MDIEGTFNTDQDKAIVQGEALATELETPAFATILRVIEENSKFRAAEWVPKMRAATAAARSAKENQKETDVTWQTENGLVRGGLEGVAAFREEVNLAIRYAKAVDFPGAGEAADLLDHYLEANTYEEQSNLLGALLSQLDELDRDGLDIPDRLMAAGRELRAKMMEDRQDADGAKAGRGVYTDELHQALERIAKLGEQRSAAQDLAAFRAGRELPGVDLTYIRAAVRTRRAPPKKDEPNDPSGDRGL
jgi:hypothetical protein